MFSQLMLKAVLEAPAVPRRRILGPKVFRYRAVLLLLVFAPACVSDNSSTAALSRQRNAPARELTLADARAFYERQPRYLRPVPYSATPQGLPDMQAKTCGLCHVAIYEEWRVSTHARAWLDDAQFQGELAKSRQTGSDVGWMCLNCHTPMENQLPRLVGKLKNGAVESPVYVDNPNFDEDLQRDAITCGTCHISEGVILGPYGDTIAPHPTRRAPELLRAELCTQCHEAQAEFVHLGLACVFSTGGEFASSEYAAIGEVCQTCHMPEVDRPIATNGPVRRSRRHWFGGSLIPKKPEFEEELVQVRSHYPDGLDLRWVDLPRSLTAGRESVLRFEIENAEAGHLLPTGDPERFIRVEARVSTAGGRLIASHRHEIGAVYEWSPTVRKVSDNRLAPRETRSFELTVVPPEGESLVLELTASKWRINEANFQYHELEGRYVAGRTFIDATVRLPVRTRSVQ